MKKVSNKKLLSIKSCSDFIEHSDFQFAKFTSSEGNLRTWRCILKDLNCLNSKPGVYIIVNKVSGFKYIGSSKNLYSRFRRHFSFYFKNLGGPILTDHQIIMKEEMTKYGIDNFEFNVCFSEVNEESRNEHFLFKLLEEECEYNVIWPKRSQDTVYSINKRGYSKEFFCVEEAALYYKISSSHIWRILDKKKVCIDKIIFSSELYSKDSDYLKDCFNKVSSEDKEGNLIYFLTVKEAALHYNISKGVVYKSLKSGRWVKKKTIRFNRVKLS